MKCFEYAAYKRSLSSGLLRLAQRSALEAVGGKHTGLADLSRRDLPNANMGDESGLLTGGFTYLLSCVDEGDEDKVPSLVRQWDLNEGNVVRFEYHGTLYYNWSTCLLVPREFAGTAPMTNLEPPEQQIERLFACIQLAHIFLGACDAMTHLFLNEIQERVGGYVSRASGGRGHRELNRVRTLALAVISLTDFSLVTPTPEDQTYFSLFQNDSKLDGRRRQISEACDLLYNVQIAEQQDQDAQGQFFLGAVVLVLTALSLVGVMVSGYDFIRAQQEVFPTRTMRYELLVGAVLVLSVIVLVIVAINRPMRNRIRND
jgi:hypothetical protein